MSKRLEVRINSACREMELWLRQQSQWHGGRPRHNPSGSVVSHHGPAILSEHDCVMHFCRFLAGAGVPWDDMHMELAPSQWMFDPDTLHTRPPRIDLAIIGRNRLDRANLPARRGTFQFDAVFEFKLASSYWRFDGKGELNAKRRPRRAIRDAVRDDIVKVASYLDDELAHLAYVIVVEECDHGGQEFWTDELGKKMDSHIEPRFLRAWQ